MFYFLLGVLVGGFIGVMMMRGDEIIKIAASKVKEQKNNKTETHRSLPLKYNPNARIDPTSGIAYAINREQFMKDNKETLERIARSVRKDKGMRSIGPK